MGGRWEGQQSTKDGKFIALFDVVPGPVIGELIVRFLPGHALLDPIGVQIRRNGPKGMVRRLMAYNLRAAMLCAALQWGGSPLVPSFSSARRHLQHWLAHLGHGENCLPQWDKMLRLIWQSRLPKRKKPGPTEPRAQRYLREPYPPLVGSRQMARQKLELSVAKS